MATTTIRGHVARALDFFERNDLYFAIGHPDAWPDESNPPAPGVSDSILNVIGYKKLETINLVVPSADGSIIYRDSKWLIVPPDQALVQGARWVYIDTYLRYDELPLSPYRQIAVYSRLVKAAGVSASKANLLPTEVADPGILEILDNRRVVNRQSDQKEQLSLVIEF